MSNNFIFKMARNPASGKQEWIKVDEEDANFFQDIARSAYADMLHDHERNVLYYQGLKSVINQFKALNPGKPVHVVDIGTGTGLLSMMAIESGADRVTAIEAFEPVAMLARRIIEKNGYSDRIKVISKRSNDINADELIDKGDIAVAEVFDTELIGENALQTFMDAQKNLLKPGARIVPSRAKFFAQIVQSDLALDWHRVKPVELPGFGVLIRVPVKISGCPGTDMMLDVQLNQFPLTAFQPVTKSFVIFEFDFEKSVAFEEQKMVRVLIDRNLDKNVKKADVVFTWWELDMDGTGSIPLSTGPDRREDSDKVVWRDHWMQNIHFLPKSVPIVPGHEISFFASHDEFTFWFNASENKRNTIAARRDFSVYKRPECECRLHQILTKHNLARFNELDRYENFCKVAQSIVPGKNCIGFGDCSLLPLIAVQLGAKHVYIVEEETEIKDILLKYVAVNGIGDQISFVEHTEQIPKDYQIEVVLVDPFFTSSFLPWHNLHFWRLVEDLRSFGFLAPNFKMIPDEVILLVLPVEFEHLWKIRAPTGNIEGFDIKIFDDVIQAAMKDVDCNIEPQPLWEYPSIALAEPQELLRLDLNESLSVQNTVSKMDFKLLNGRNVNGVVFWMEWYCKGDAVCSSGLEQFQTDNCSIIGCKPMWRKSYKQAVHFPAHPFKQGGNLSIECKLDLLNEDCEFKIEVL